MLVEKNGQFIVSEEVVEFIVPEFYEGRNLLIEGAGIYSVFCVGGVRIFRDKKDYLKNGSNSSAKIYPVVLPVMIETRPTEVLKDSIEIPKGGTVKDIYKLVYYKGDVFVDSDIYIKGMGNVNAAYKLFDDGKLDFLSMENMIETLEMAVALNGSNLPLPMECIHAMIAVRSMNVKDPSKQVRFMDETPSAVTLLNPRETMMSSTSSQMYDFEDVNKSLLISNTRVSKGIVDQASDIERITILGQP